MSSVSEAGRVVKAYVLSRTVRQQKLDRLSAREWARSVEVGHVVASGSGEVERFLVWVPSALRERGLKLRELPGCMCFEVVPYLETNKE